MSTTRKPIVIGTSPLTGTIFAGTLLKGNLDWSSNKQDVTKLALGAVGEHVLFKGGAITLCNADGEPALRITVEDLR